MPKRTQRGSGNFQADPKDYIARHAERHAAAETVDRDIGNLAFPGTGANPGVPETLASEDPESVGFSVMGGLMPHHMLNANQTLRKWEVPPLPPSHDEGFGSSVRANIAAGNLPDTPIQRDRHEHWLGKLAERGNDAMQKDPLGHIVNSRKDSIATSLASGDPDAAWYQGKAQALIHHAAGEAGVSVPVMRKVTAAESSRMDWDHTYSAKSKANVKSGLAGTTTFPNIEYAGRIIGASAGRTEDEAHEEVARQKVPGVGRKDAARVAVRMERGEMSGSDPLPLQGLSEKRKTFDVNLSDPNHAQHGYSAWVERHQLSGHTGDVQDARAGGFHEDNMVVERPLTGKVDKEGIATREGKPIHEAMLMEPAGADITQSTALVARTEAFTAGRQKHGEEWAAANAKNFMSGPAQSMQWSVNRKEGNVAVPEHVQQAYDSRPAPTGFGGYSGKGTRITKRDREQM